MHISTLFLVLASLVATDAQSADVTQVNAATITDATGAIQTPTESIAQVSPTVIANVVSSNGVNPLKAPDAVTATNLEASTVATDTLSTDLVRVSLYVLLMLTTDQTYHRRSSRCTQPLCTDCL